MLRYIGKAFIVGVPARDLTDEELTRFNKRRLLDSGLYIEVREKKVKKKYQETEKQSDSESEEE